MDLKGASSTDLSHAPLYLFNEIEFQVGKLHKGSVFTPFHIADRETHSTDAARDLKVTFCTCHNNTIFTMVSVT